MRKFTFGAHRRCTNRRDAVVFFPTGEIIPGACGADLSEQPGELVSVLQRVKFDKSPHHCDQRFSSIFNNILRTMAYKAPSIDENAARGPSHPSPMLGGSFVAICLFLSWACTRP